MTRATLALVLLVVITAALQIGASLQASETAASVACRPCHD
jgi:hypothetical protein